MGFNLDKHYLKGYTLPEGEIEKVALETGDPIELVTKQITVAVNNINRAYAEGVVDTTKFVLVLLGTGVCIGAIEMIFEEEIVGGCRKLKEKFKSRKEKKQVTKETGA